MTINLYTILYSVVTDKDPCPQDVENDLDGDNLCARDDRCPKDEQNDADSDGLCGDVDRCPLDKENDIDGDMLCSGICVGCFGF